MPAVPSISRQASGASLAGKVPAKPDFVRYGPFGRAAQAFDAWLVRAIERLHVNRGSLVPGPIRFAYAPNDAGSALIGVLAPSKDKIGRTFPVAIFHTAPLATVLDCPAAIPHAYRSFFEQVEALLGELPSSSHAEVEARLAALDGPSPEALSTARAASREQLRSTTASVFLEAAFGPAPAGKHFYGLLTLLRAADSTRAQAARAPMLDCPATSVTDIETWLECVHQVCPSPNASFFWNEREPSRVLFRWGPPSDDLLCALGDSNYGSSAVWPLFTEREAAVASAQATLAAPFAKIAPGTSSTTELVDLLRTIKL
jgi:type VI secretion system protein ImpM